MSLVVPEPLWQRIRNTLRDDGIESACIALANRAGSGTATKLLLNDVRIPNPTHYSKQGALTAELSPEFVAAVVREARDRRMSTIFIHTHPFAERAAFSKVDDDGELLLKGFVERRIPDVPHATLVLGRAESCARLLGTSRRVDVSVIGSVVERFAVQPDSEVASGNHPELETFDRQIRAFGLPVQQRLATLNIGIVGLGGTGSIVAEQLAHLGVNRFVLVDADVVERSNLNRVVGASVGDLGRPKVNVASDMIRRIRPTAALEPLRTSILQNDSLGRLRTLDAIFCCTDSHGSRYVLNEFAYRFLIPCFDCGVVVVAEKSSVTHVAGRAQMLAPGLACLTCTQALEPEQIRRDLLAEFERARDPYILGGTAPQPAVVSLNGVTVSLAITMFLGAFGGLPVLSRHQRYNAINGTVRSIDATPVDRCVTCSPSGGLAAGDSWPLPGRPE